VAATEFSWLELPGCGLGTVAQDVPFQNRVRVCGCEAPGGVQEPAARTLAGVLPSIPVSTAPVPGEGAGTTLHRVPSQCSVSVPAGL
jgi:hypothetical protein